MRIGAIEAGGTKMVLAVGSIDGDIFDRQEIPTEEPELTIPKMIEWFKDKNIDALGIGAFGPTDVNTKSKTYGYILDTPKLRWRHTNFLGQMADALQVPAGYDTDVNVACLGESIFGAGKNIQNLIYITIGTGIGAGVMVDGNLLHGTLHPEAGHILISKETTDAGECICPYHDSCFEGLAAGPSIEKRWEDKAINLKDKVEVWDLESTYIAKALVTYVMCYSPECIILGGGVMKQTQLFDLIRNKFAKYLGGYITTEHVKNPETYIVSAGCGGDQGILGCIALGARAHL